MREERYGWRAQIGLLSPGPTPALVREWNCVLPEGVIFYHALMGLLEGTAEGMMELRAKAVGEAQKLTREGLVDIVLFACTAGSFVGGAGYDEEIINELEAATGTLSTTTATCMLTAFADLGVRKIALIGPYIDEVFDLQVRFLKHHGIETLYCKGMGYAKDPARNVGEDPYLFYRWAKEAHRSAPGADAIFVSGMLSPILRVVGALEQETGKPVISSNSAGLYGVLKQLGIKDPIEPYGQLLKIPR